MSISETADVRRLRIFLEVADQLSFSRAAQRLFLSQPNVSTVVKQLERSCGELLFERRKSRRVTLTDAGKVLYGHAKKLVIDAELMGAAMEGLRGAIGGEVAIGAVNQIESELLEMLVEFKIQHPRVRVVSRFGTSQTLCDFVTAGQLSLAIVGAHAKDRRLEATALHRWDSELKVLVPKNHALARLQVVQPHMLLGCPFVRYATQFHAAVDEHLSQSGLEPDYVMEIESLEGVKRAVARGIGVTLLSAAMARQPSEHQFVVLDLDAQPYSTGLFYLRQKNRPMPTAERVLVDYVSKGLATMIEGGRLPW